MSSKQNDSSHFAYIDATRGIAFLSVLAFHAAVTIDHFPGRALLAQGCYGVQLFFLASAITLCFSMSRRQTVDRFPILFFFIRRFFRIAPLFWAALLVYWRFPNLFPRIWTLGWAPYGRDHSFYYLTAAFLNGWHPNTLNSVVPGGWSIAVEMTFYATFPFLFRAISNIKRAAVAVLVALCVSPAMSTFIYPKLRSLVHWHTSDTVYDFFQTHWFPSQLPVFLIGMFTYFLLRNRSIQEFSRNKFWAGCLLCFSIMLLVSLLLGSSFFIPLQLLNVMALSGIIIALSGNFLSRILNLVLCYIGKISFSCYLVHFGAMGLSLKILGISVDQNALVFNAGSSFGNLLLFGEHIFLSLGFTLVVSSITLVLIENPGIQIGRKVIRWIDEFQTRSLPVPCASEIRENAGEIPSSGEP